MKITIDGKEYTFLTPAKPSDAFEESTIWWVFDVKESDVRPSEQGD